MADLDNFMEIAAELLTADAADATRLEHSRRVLRTCEAIVELPELTRRRIDRHCLFVAAIFHEVGAVGGDAGRDEAEVRSRSADRLAAHAAELLTARPLARCQRILRESVHRGTPVIEAQVLSDAINLEDLGALGVWRELARFAAAGRGVAEALISWQRKIEYNYFQARIRETLRFESVRRIAARRLEAVVDFMEQLKREHFAEDLKQPPERPGRGT